MPQPASPTSPTCPKCDSTKTARIKRQGLLRTLILHRFGFYPWECSGCRTVFLTRNRGKLKRRRRTTGEVPLPPIGESR